MSAAPAALLELQAISRRFGDVVALDDASLRVEPGTIHALLGENGAGKTTLMRVAFGLVKPDSGRVLIDGSEQRLANPASAIALGVGMVHQHFTLVPAMSVAENIALGQHGRFDLRRVTARIADIANASGLRVDPGSRAEDLSVASQQRVEILKALYLGARMLILDEPTAVLAPTEAADLMRWLRSYAARGNAVVLITHKLREALSVADDVTVLRNGRVALTSRVEVATEAELTRAILGDAVEDSIDERPATSVGSVVVEVGGVSARLGREAVAGVDVAIRGGEIVGVAGVEGSGHHTLLRLLAGRLHPGLGLLRLPETIGFIPEDRLRDAGIPEFTLAENYALRGAGSRTGLLVWGAMRLRAGELAVAQDVRGVWPGDASATRLGSLSGGNQQKFVAARELDRNPLLIVAENPTRGLDIRAAAALRAALESAAAGGAAVVVYSSDLDEVVSLASRVLVVHAGRVTEQRPDRDIVGRAMLGAA